MGQRIEVTNRVIGDTAVFDTDRSITGQDGVVFDSAEAAAAGEAFPHVMAQRLFAADDAIDSVFVASNTVTVKRAGEWDDAALEQAGGVVRDFFVFYG